MSSSQLLMVRYDWKDQDLTSADFNRLKTLVSALPVVNQVVIELLVYFLSNVMDHQSKNKMDINAIVIVFGPNFLRQVIFIELYSVMI